ncbi:MAG: Uma2 family endonuclease [Gemmataceae bacterium]|nr:Uma2 family endonuclease [Gemmataceae bacterium]
MTTATMPMTTADLLALPDDGKRRWLIKGELREQDMTVRNRFHSKTMANVSGLLFVWRSGQPLPRGDVVCGEAGVRLPGIEPETTIGVDVAYVSPDVLVQQSEQSTIIVGIPTLVVEILSPNDTQEEIDEMVEAYVKVGVPLVWLVDPTDRTVTIYRPGEEPTLVNSRQKLDGGTVLPGFSVPVAQIFD